MVPCSSPYHRSPWWVTTGVAPWCGPWPASIPRESGKHTHRHTQSPRACTVKLKCFSMCVKGCGIVEHPNVQVESFGSCFRETEGYSNIRLSGLLPNTSKCYIYIYKCLFLSQKNCSFISGVCVSGCGGGRAGEGFGEDVQDFLFQQ